MSRDTSTDSTGGTGESTDGRDEERDLDISRRDFSKAVGLASAATVAGASTGSASAAISDSDVVSVGSGGYTTAMPSDANIDATYGVSPSASEVYTTANASGPVPSNDWWSTVILGTNGDPHGQGSLAGMPYHANTNQRGLTIQYPSDWFGDPAEEAFLKTDYVNTPMLTIGHTGNSSFADSRADDWGDWHLRTRWGDGTSTTLDVTLLKGSPFFYAEYEGGDAEITLETKDSTADSPALADSSNITVWADRGNVLGITVDGITADNYSKHYALFAPSGSTWSGVGSATLTSSLNGQGYLTVAVLPDASTSTLDLFEQYAYNFVRDTTVDWNYVETDANGNPVSEVRTTYQFTTENKAESSTGANETLACLFPHQWKHTDAALTGLTYFSPRGELRVHEGSSFTTSMPYRGILPFMPDEGSYDTATLSSYVDDLEAAPFWQNGTGSDTDTYFSGKDLNRTKQGIPIAQQVGDTAARDSFLDALKTRLASWFSVNDTFAGTAEEEEVFYYNTDIGSLIGYPDGFGSATILNDHHFHYGYMINAAAEVARMDDQWVQEYGDMVDLVIREYANWDRPSGTDPYGSLPVDSPSDAFPFLRNFDPYSGHSWAGGDGAAADGNNQESSSEAINAYAGIIKWAEYTGNTEMRDAAIFMYTQEIHAIWDYWFDPNHDSFPDTWGDNVNDNSIGGPDFNYASIVWGTGYDHHVFWGTQDQVEIFGINWLPINGHSLYLGWDENYAAGNWDDLIRTRGDDTNFLGGWKTAAWGYRALHDPADAVSLAEAELPLDDTNASGSSSAFTYHWVHNLNAMGTVDTATVADVPMHAVFDDGSSKTYVAYNPSSSAQTVNFSDGYSMEVPANAQKTSNGSVTEGLAGGSDGGGGGGGGDEQAPYNGPHYVPGTVEAEDFDTGGEGVAYHDTTSGNDGGASYRNTDVDIESATENGYNVCWSVDGEWLEYTVQVESDGDYDVTARVASDLGGGSFDLSVDGTQVASTSFAATGGWQAWQTVDVGTVSLTAGEHVIRVDMTASDWNLNWIDFASASGDTQAPTAPANLSSSSNTDSSVDLDWDASTDDTGVDHYNVYVDGNVDHTVAAGSTATTVSGLSAGTTYDFHVTAVDAAGNESADSNVVSVTTDSGSSDAVFAVNAGGSSYTASDGTTYQADTAYSGGSTASVSDPIANTDDDTLYQSERWGDGMSYDVSVADGTYDVELHFAEIFFSSDGSRVFNVAVEGTEEISGLDVHSEVGHDVAMVQTVSGVSVSDGTLNITFTADVDNAKIAAIKVVESSSGGDSTAPTAPTNLSSPSNTDSSVDLDWDAASDSGTGVDHYNVYRDGGVDHQVSAGTTATTVTGLAADTSYDFQVSAVDGAGNESSLSSVLTVTTDASSGQSPYNGPHNLPGTVQAEDFDTGGSGVAYSDSDSANNGGSYRDTAVDIEGATEGGYNVGWTAADEWLEYTVQVDSDGTYDLNARVASNGGGGAFRVEVDGTDATGTVSVADTGGWQSWSTVTVSGVDLTAGEHVLRVYVESGGFNLNWLEFVQTSSGGGTSYSGTTGDGWSATVTEVGTDQYEWSFEPNNAAGWADVQIAETGTDAWVGYRMDDSDGDNVHLYTRDTSSDASEIDFRFVWDDGAGGQYTSERRTHTY